MHSDKQAGGENIIHLCSISNGSCSNKSQNTTRYRKVLQIQKETKKKKCRQLPGCLLLLCFLIPLKQPDAPSTHMQMHDVSI